MSRSPRRHCCRLYVASPHAEPPTLHLLSSSDSQSSIDQPGTTLNSYPLPPCPPHTATPYTLLPPYRTATLLCLRLQTGVRGLTVTTFTLAFTQLYSHTHLLTHPPFLTSTLQSLLLFLWWRWGGGVFVLVADVFCFQYQQLS